MMAETIKKAMWDCQRNGGQPKTVAMTRETFDQLVYECRDVLVHDATLRPINTIYGLLIDIRRDMPKDVTMIIY